MRYKLLAVLALLLAFQRLEVAQATEKPGMTYYVAFNPFEVIYLGIDANGSVSLYKQYVNPGSTVVHKLAFSLSKSSDVAEPQQFWVSKDGKGCGVLTLTHKGSQDTLSVSIGGSTQAFTSVTQDGLNGYLTDLQRTADLQRDYKGEPLELPEGFPPC